MNRRDQIRMSDDEVVGFLEVQRTVTCATIGRDGFAHLMPLWYVVRDSASFSKLQLSSWTFAKSQKVRNLERLARATLQVEAGDEYHELRGVMIKADVTIDRDTDRVAAFGLELFRRYTGELTDEIRAMVAAQAPKRVVLQFAERSRVSWDHRKLGTASA